METHRAVAILFFYIYINVQGKVVPVLFFKAGWGNGGIAPRIL
jgi:hypothetical protein